MARYRYGRGRLQPAPEVIGAAIVRIVKGEHAKAKAAEKPPA